jgi:hypothetical protein
MDMLNHSPSRLFDAWRLAERRLSRRDPDATDFEDIQRECDRLRAEWQRLDRSAAASVGARDVRTAVAASYRDYDAVD